MTTYSIRIIDGTTNQAGTVWPDAALPCDSVEAESAELALDQLEELTREWVKDSPERCSVTIFVSDGEDESSRFVEIDDEPHVVPHDGKHDHQTCFTCERSWGIGTSDYADDGITIAEDDDGTKCPDPECGGKMGMWSTARGGARRNAARRPGSQQQRRERS